MHIQCNASCRVNRLQWHNIIPQDEVWVKVGGDKGATTFKMSFQIGNTPNPNSIENTCVFTVFEAKDTRSNLRVALERYVPQISAIQKESWRYTCVLMYMHMQMCVPYLYMLDCALL